MSHPESVFLYVEDELSNRKVVDLIMGRMMKVEHLYIFENSADFMARVKTLPQRPNIILLDIHIEPYDGFEMLHMLRSDPDYQQATVIALTASVTNEEVEKLRSNGFDGAIGKPLNVALFPGLMERIIQGEAVWHIS